MMLGATASVLHFGDIARSAAHLLDGFIYPTAPSAQTYSHAQTNGRFCELTRFCELDRFYLPLTSQLNPRRDNISNGPWEVDRGPFAPFAHIFHHLRCLSGEKACLRENCHLWGFKLDRVSRCFSTHKEEWVGERRISIAVVARFHEEKDPARCNSLLLMSPGSDLVETKMESAAGSEVEDWKSSPDQMMDSLRLSRVGGDYAPVFTFLVLYASAIDLWSLHWRDFVRSVENLRQDDVSQRL